MSKLSEYLKLLPAGFANLDKVIEGVRNELKLELGVLPKEEEEVIIGRRLICSTCPFMSKNAQKAGWYSTKRTEEHCTGCGCPLNIRTASLESNCGLEDYNKQYPTVPPIELKWKKTK
jgi:hypothetical protein